MSHAPQLSPLPVEDDLSRLLAAEQRLEALVADGRAEAERIVDAAATAAATKERELDAELDRETRELTTRLEAEGAHVRAGILAEADAIASRFDGVPPQTIEAIARRMVDLLVTAP